MRLIALKYQISSGSGPVRFGVTFSKKRAEEFGLDPKETLNALLQDLKLKDLRLVSYWSEHQKTDSPNYDFTELDWQFEEANKFGAKVSLSIGLRQPRWPECHAPQWASSIPKEQWYPKLKNYISAVVKRYKNNPALKSWQLENEYFLDVFGECPDFSRDRLVEEFNLVKAEDPNHPVIISRSNNLVGLSVNDPKPDIDAISVYRKVYNPTLGYIAYPIPPWYYSFLAEAQKNIDGRPTIVHEFQLEPWLKSGQLQDSTLADQNITMSQKDVELNLEYAKRIGIKEVYLWGGEWWYWRLKKGDPSIWDTVRSGIE
jgi:hypothetical protein